MNLRQLSIAVILALTAALPFQAAEQFPSRILRSLNRSATFHPSQAGVFQFDVLEAIGGVLSQTNRLIAETGESGPFSITADLENGQYPGYVTVHHMGTQTQYSIEYSDLVPMALFVDSGGTSLYTLWRDQDLPPSFLHEAGFMEHNIDGELALEFNDTRYANALYFVDLCEYCLDDQAIHVGVDLEKDLWKSADGRGGSSYINTDVRLPFHFSVVAGSADLTGGIARFEWRTSADVSIDALPVLREPERTLQNLFGAFTDSDILTALNEDSIQQAMEAARSVDDTTRRLLADGFFLFETLALLRTAKTDVPEKWSEFMRLLSSEELVNADPSPWDRYTRSVCAAYPGTTECGN